MQYYAMQLGWIQLAGFVCFVSFLSLIAKVIRVAFDKDLRAIPGPWICAFTALPLNFAVIGARRTAYIHSLHEKYGPYVRIAPTEIAIADIDAWRKIHRVGSDFNKGPWYQGQLPGQYSDETCGVFAVLDNKAASRRRRLFQTAGTKKVVSEWEPRVLEVRDAAIEQMKRDFEVKGKSDIMKWWTLMTCDVLGSLAFGDSFNNVQQGEKTQLIRDIDHVMLVIGLRMTLPLVRKVQDNVPPRILKLFLPSQMAAPLERFGAYGRRAVENTRAAMKGGMKTLFSKMADEEESKVMIPDVLIEQEAANVIIAGTDTTASALTYLTYYVLKNPDIQKRLVKELQTLPPRPTWPELENLPYLNNVIHETLRIQPPIPGSLTRVVPPGGTHFAKYTLPAGTLVSTQAYTFHHDPTVFPNPSTFNPNRWTTPTAPMKEHFMPFGGPARTCVGQNIARLEMLHAVAGFFRAFPDVQLAPDTTDEGMQVVDYFSIKPVAGKCEAVVKVE